jgi:hypothetical protein
MDNIVNLNVTPLTAPDEEFSVLIQNEIYTVRRKGDYPYRLVLSHDGAQLFVLPVEYPADHVTTAIRAYLAGRDRGRAAGRNEIRESLSKLLRMETVS